MTDTQPDDDLLQRGVRLFDQLQIHGLGEVCGKRVAVELRWMTSPFI